MWLLVFVEHLPPEGFGSDSSHDPSMTQVFLPKKDIVGPNPQILFGFPSSPSRIDVSGVEPHLSSTEADAAGGAGQ